LVQWMQKPGTDGKERCKVSPRDILREGPARLRDKGRRDAAAKMLLATRHIFEGQEPSGTLWVLNPTLRETSLGFGTLTLAPALRASRSPCDSCDTCDIGEKRAENRLFSRRDSAATQCDKGARDICG